MNFLVVFSALIFLSFCNCRKLPPSFKRCDVKKDDFNQCLTNAIPDAIRQMRAPIKALGLPSLDPLVIPSMTIAPGPGPTGFQQNYTNLKVSGFTDISCTKIELDFKNLSMVMMCNSPGIRVDTEYWFNGTVASILPIYGNGTGRITLEDMGILHSFSLSEYYKKGKKHFKVENSSIEVFPNLITFKFDNLYDGDKLWTDNINHVMNDNWREIFEDVKPIYQECFTIIFQAFFNRVLSRISVSDIFING